MVIVVLWVLVAAGAAAAVWLVVILARDLRAARRRRHNRAVLRRRETFVPASWNGPRYPAVVSAAQVVDEWADEMHARSRSVAAERGRR